ncbi:MAG: sulfotransferase family 2 domain-containing protein [Pseudomonadota bacterium]
MSWSKYHHLIDYVPSWRLKGAAMRLLRPARAQVIDQSRQMNHDLDMNVVPFFEHDCLFIHIPKTAGISLIDALFGQPMGLSHTRIRTYRMLLSDEEYRRFHKFCFVRNPYDRLYSAFSFLKTGGLTAEDAAWTANNLYPYATFEQFVMEWLSEEAAHSYYHFQPQVGFTHIRGVNQMDFTGRFETLAEDYDTLRARLGTGAGLKRINVGEKRQAAWRELYTSAMLDRVGKIYARDFESFGYEIE